AAQAAAFETAGFTHLHVVDLDGAFAGRAENRSAVEAILQRVRMPVQLGGGIRTLDQITGWLEAGVQRVILGTAALRDPELVREGARRYPGQIVVGIDAKGCAADATGAGFVAVEGWAQGSDMPALDLARRFEDAGVAAIVFTDIERDGRLQGVNVEATRRIAAATAIPVIASGGVAGIGDVEALVAGGGVAGVITGRALYDGRLDPAEALAAAG
ncbi:MAG: HisA/HisF-related TIM barrel protein, partial [Pseudomonadota bacterium]